MRKKSKFSFKRFKSIMIKEFIQVKRDPISMRIPIIMPIVMMLLFGYAVNTEVDKIPTAVLDQCKTQESREYLDKFTASNYFDIVSDVTSEDELSKLIDSGKVKAGITIPDDFSVSIEKGMA